MAAESLNSQQRLAGLIDRLPLLLDGLRSDGFEIGAGEYLAVHRLLLRLGETGRLPSEVRKLRSFLGPLLCASAEEQRRFAGRFAAWAAVAEPRAKADVLPETDHGFDKEIKLLRRWTPTFRWKRWLIGIGAVSAAAMAGWILWPWISSLRFPTGVFESDDRISFARLIGALLAFGVLSVVVRDLFRRLLVGRALRRGGVGDGGTFRKASVFAAPEWPRLFSEPMLTEIARAMRRPEPAGGWELDPAETVERSVQCGGRFSPVYSPRRRMPETLALVDRRAWRDHQSAWAEALLAALAERDAPVSVFFFDGDPRVCFSPAAGPRPVSLDHLARRYPDARLLMFSDGVGPVDIAPFRGSPWRNRAWITMGDPSVGAAEKMAAAGFEVEPASEKGFWDVTAAFNGVPLGGNGRSFGSARPSDTVVADSMAMRWQESPASKDLEALVAALRGLMDAAGWQWFCACAVYPELRWGLTLHLGAVLTGAEGAPLYSCRRLFTLCRMPWFRHGAMPDWLRRRLMDEPAFRGKSEKRVRRLLFLLLKGVAPSGRLELEVAAPVDRFIPSLMRGMARRRGGDRALRDPVFMGFMTNSLAVRISRETATHIRHILYKAGNSNERAFAIAVAVKAKILHVFYRIVLCMNSFAFRTVRCLLIWFRFGKRGIESAATTTVILLRSGKRRIKSGSATTILIMNGAEGVFKKINRRLVGIWKQIRRVRTDANKGLEISQIGPYRIVKKIRHGGMATLYLVEGDFSKRLVLKMLNTHLVEYPEFIQRFQREGRLAAMLEHPNVVRFWDFGEYDDNYFILMEYVDGLNLSEIQERLGSYFSVDQTVYLLLQIGYGLQYIHNKVDDAGRPLRMVHRDISPQNILVTMEGEVKISDFGIAKVVQYARVPEINSVSGMAKTKTLETIVEREYELTQFGTFLGKFKYASPEQLRGEKVDHRADIYSLGVVGYELLDRHSLFNPKTLGEALRFIEEKGTFPRLSASSLKVPSELETILDKAVERNPDHRYQSVTEMIEALERFRRNFSIVYGRSELARFMSDVAH